MQRSDLLRAIIVGWKIAAKRRTLARREKGAAGMGCTATTMFHVKHCSVRFFLARGRILERADVFDFRVFQPLLPQITP
jgi:hypothetical protein